MRLLGNMFGAGGNGAAKELPSDGLPSLDYLPCLPWTVWPERNGTRGVIRDANLEWVIEIDCRSRAVLIEFAKLIEQATRTR